MRLLCCINIHLSFNDVRDLSNIGITFSVFFLLIIGGFALLPFLWLVNVVWFFREAFIKPTYAEQLQIRTCKLGQNSKKKMYSVFLLYDAVKTYICSTLEVIMSFILFKINNCNNYNSFWLA